MMRPTEKVIFEQRLKGGKGGGHMGTWGKSVPGRTACAKALRQDHASCG